MGKRRRSREREHKKHCLDKFDESFEILCKLLNHRAFIRAAKASTTPRGFRRNASKLLNFADQYHSYRISLSASDGRTYFDSAFPRSSHDGTYVKDINGNNINVSGGIEVQYTNFVAYGIIYERSTSHNKCGVGADARWDETVGTFQYFVAKTVSHKTSQCDAEKFILRVSHKPDSITDTIFPIRVQQFAVIDDQPFIIVDNNIIPVKPENITVVNGQRFALVNGQTFLLPRDNQTKMNNALPLL